MKKTFLCVGALLTMLMLGLAGCGQDAGKGTSDTAAAGMSGGAEQTEGTAEYYIMEETAVPNTDQAFEAEVADGGSLFYGDPQLLGDYVYRNTMVAKKEEGEINNTVYLYDRVFNVNDSTWEEPALYGGYVVDGKTYYSMQPYRSPDGQTYAVLYDKENKFYLALTEEDGIAEILGNISILGKGDDFEEGIRICRNKDGEYFYYRTSGSCIMLMDSALQTQETIFVSGKVYGILQKEAGADTYWYGVDSEGKACIAKIGDENVCLIKEWEGVATLYTAGYSKEGILYIADAQNVWRLDDDGEPQLVFPFVKRDYLVDAVYNMDTSEDGEFRLLVALDGECAILEMKRSDTDPMLNRQEIVMAFAARPFALEEEAVRFNRQNPQYHVSVVYPGEEEDAFSFRDRILLQVSTGEGPDILGDDMVIDVASLVDGGYLECLDGLITDETAYLQVALENARVDGKLYGVPYECTFDFVSYPAAFADGRTSWTLPDLMKAVSASDAKILQKGCSALNIVLRYGLWDNDNTAYIDWEKGESHLTEQPFLDLLAFAKKYGDDGTLVEADAVLLREGESVSVQTSLYDTNLSIFYALWACLKGEPAMLGYPRQEGNGIYVSAKELYLNASATQKDGAKEFLKYLLSSEAQVRCANFDTLSEMSEKGLRTMFGNHFTMPVHLDAYETIIANTRTRRNEFLGNDYGAGYKSAPFTEEQEEQFRGLLANCEPANFRVSEISYIIAEELEPYFIGEASAEDVAEKLHNRVQLYLDERKK